MLIEWKDKYRTGIAEVDFEHRELIELLNRLHDEATRSVGADLECFFGDLLAAISAHFALEERTMREAGYPAYAAHKSDHERLLDDLRDIMESQQDASSVGPLGAALDAWFTIHFATHDARLASTPGLRH